MDFRTRTATSQDPLVSRALERFEKELGRRWTVEELAQELATSRPVLARHFVHELGAPPLRVLRQLRMNRAAHILSHTDEPLISVADEVGYDSEFAFSRAFYRQFGIRPGQYRKQSAGSTRSTTMLAMAA